MDSDTLRTTRRSINQAYRTDEALAVQYLLTQLAGYPADATAMDAQALLEKYATKFTGKRNPALGNRSPRHF